MGTNSREKGEGGGMGRRQKRQPQCACARSVMVAGWEAALGHLHLGSVPRQESGPLHPAPLLDLDWHLQLSLEGSTGTIAHATDLESSRTGSEVSGSLQGSREGDDPKKAVIKNEQQERRQKTYYSRRGTQHMSLNHSAPRFPHLRMGVIPV